MLQMVLVPFETRRMPPTNAPFMRQLFKVSSTDVQSYAQAVERDMLITIAIKSRIILYNNQIPSVSIMKALSNTQSEGKNQVEHPEQLHKRLAELRQTNAEKETLINNLEQEVKELQETNNGLKQQKQVQERLWDEVREKEEEKEEEDEHEMQEWIEQVQKQNGLSQEAIDSLLTIEFEGGQQEICPACYQQLKAGVMCTYLPCAHLFHRDCIVNHLRVNRFCLACQEEVVL